MGRGAPAPINAQNIGVSAFQKRVEVQFAAAPADPTGVGLAGYWIYRDGLYLMRTQRTTLTEALPDGVDEPRGPVPDRELRQLSVGRGDQFEPATGQFFCYPSGMARSICR